MLVSDLKSRCAVETETGGCSRPLNIMMGLHKLLATITAIALVAISNTAAFATTRCGVFCGSVHFPKGKRHPGGAPLLESPAEGERRQKHSTARLGGRRVKKQKAKKVDTTNTNDGVFATIRQIATIVLATLLLRFLFGNIFGGSGNVVYYSSSVYQSTTYSIDGKTETKRKESFESNIPGLVERAKERSQGNNGNGATRGSYYDIDSDIEDELLDVEDEINSIFGQW